jgi:acetyltransferase EpsM
MKLVVIGASGNGAVVRSTMEDLRTDGNDWEFLGYLDDNYSSNNADEVIGKVSSQNVEKLLNNSDLYFFFSLNSVKLQTQCKTIWDKLRIPAERCATLIHPTAVVSQFSKISTGVAVQPLVNIGPGVQIASNVHIFAQAMIGHNSVLHNFAYVANNACIGGYCTLEEGAYVGTNATLIENITLGSWSLVGLGATVLKDVGPNKRVAGNPAKSI